MKLSKKQKIITSLIGTGVILALTIGITIPLLTNQEDKTNQEYKINNDASSTSELITKIKNKNLFIPKDVNTFSDSEILLAIKNQLKLKNPSLTNQDLLKITDNIQHLKPGKKTIVILTIKSSNKINIVNINVTKEKNIKLWAKDSAIVTNSNIFSGRFSTFIQDSSGNLWSMGGQGGSRKSFVSYKPTKLQVLKRNGTQWEEDTNNGLTKGSNITNGSEGIIFEDDFGNLWAMGKGTKLQVLVKNKDGSYAESWVNDNGENGEKLLQGSNINNGEGGTMFQDVFGNLWAMGNGSKLQVLVKNKDGSYAESWVNDNGENGEKLLQGSNINNGKRGRIFQDVFGNLWAMGKGSKLQVLVKNKDGSYASSWDTDNSENGQLLKNSNIVSGENGTIFQDSFGNLWAMGNGTKLQVLKANSSKDGYINTGWNKNNLSSSNGLLKNSNIIDCWRGTMIQDSFGNLWAQGYQRKPQVLKVNQNGDGYDENTGWTSDNTQGLLNNLKSNTLTEWFFFQDSSKNLWAGGKDAKLQLLKVNETGNDYVSSWTDDNTQNGEILLKNSNIDAGGWLIFEDSSKNLWSLGNIWSVKSHEIPKLQVYDKTQKRWIS